MSKSFNYDSIMTISIWRDSGSLLKNFISHGICRKWNYKEAEHVVEAIDKAAYIAQPLESTVSLPLDHHRKRVELHK